jgi:5-methylcytosine-specific restriction endonuclease McrA
VTSRLREPENEIAHRLSETVDALIRRDEHAAARGLAPIAGQLLRTHPVSQLPTLTQIERRAGARSKRVDLDDAVIAGVYTADSFTCVYCGQLTIPVGVLRLISHHFNEDFSFHAYWRGDACHPAYWDISTSFEHRDAGDLWTDPANLVTSCARCNYQKGDTPIELLGWEPRRRRSAWDGLAGRYRALWDALGRPEPSYHRRWIGLFERVLAVARNA